MTTCSRGCVLALGLVVFLHVPSPAIAADGDLDPKFGGTGVVTTGFGALTSAYAREVGIQGNGRIVAVGYVSGGGNIDIAVARWMPNGTLDPSFGAGTGRVRLPFDLMPEGTDYATELLLRADGRMWVGGFSFDGVGIRCTLARLLANGEPDDSFSGDGLHIVAGDCAIVRALLELPGGQLLVAMVTGSDSGAVCRLDGTTGAIDPTYGNLGCRTLESSPMSIPQPRDMVGLIDGTVLVAGTVLVDDPGSPPSSNMNAGLARLSGGGNLVGSFGFGGIASCHWETASGFASSSEFTNAVKVGVEGSAYLTGSFKSDTSADYYAGVCRFDAETGQWLAFGPSFAPFFALGDTGYAQGFDLAVALDGKLVVVGTKDGTFDMFGVETGTARLGTDGILDSTYSGDGKRHVNVSPEAEEAWGVALQHDGAIVVAGWGEGFAPTPESGNGKMIVLRVQAGLPFRDNFETGDTIYWTLDSP